MKTEIERKLGEGFSPQVLLVDNESHKHSVPKGSETHFKVTLVSELFRGMSSVDRHRKVYGVLSGELQNGVHALQLHTYTPEEYAKIASIPEAPPCQGGAGK